MLESQHTSSHPPGLRTLFFTELWERFSYYGMRALLVLFMVGSVESGGLGLDDKLANSIYGLYTASVYLTALPGGWIADRLLGARRSVWYGGLLIAAGHFTLAVPRTDTFYLGLVLIVLGTGLLKPNISVLVGRLYPAGPEGGGARDAGFTIFYMGINLGAALGPIICSYLGEKLNWHYGFAAAGVGMVFSLVYFRLTQHRLVGEVARPELRSTGGAVDLAWVWPAIGVLGIAVVTALIWTKAIDVDAVRLARASGYVILFIGAVFWLRIVLFGKLQPEEMRRMVLMALLVVAAALFWAGFEQAGSSLNLFAERHTSRTIWNWPEIPAGWFQTLNPVFIITLSPLVASLWITLARSGRDLSIPAKFGSALVLLGLGFLVMYVGSQGPSAGHKAMPGWLVMTYLFHTLGELCLSPVGLSAVSKLAPQRFVGQVMGLWFLGTSLGNLIAGLFAGEAMSDATQMPQTFLQFAAMAAAGGALFLVGAPRLVRWVDSR